jgi:hypothetical protein
MRLDGASLMMPSPGGGKAYTWNHDLLNGLPVRMQQGVYSTQHYLQFGFTPGLMQQLRMGDKIAVDKMPIKSAFMGKFDRADAAESVTAERIRTGWSTAGGASLHVSYYDGLCMC